MAQQYFDSKLKIFALNSNRPLAEKIAETVGVPLGKLQLIDLVMEKSVSTSMKVSVETISSSFSRPLLQSMTI